MQVVIFLHYKINTIVMHLMHEILTETYLHRLLNKQQYHAVHA